MRSVGARKAVSARAPDLRPHRVADHHRARLHRGRRLLQRREGAGDGRDARGQQPVGAAHHRVLLVDHGRAAAG